MTQAQGMKAAHSQAKGPNYHGNKVTSCFTAPPSSQEPGKMFQQNFLYSPPPFFLVVVGWSELGGREPAVLEACSKPDALLKVSWEKPRRLQASKPILST